MAHLRKLLLSEAIRQILADFAKANTTSRQIAVRSNIRFVFIPKNSSWLNQIEMVFGVIARRAMRNGNFTGLEDLETKLHKFIDYFNQTFVEPITWKYDGS